MKTRCLAIAGALVVLVAASAAAQTAVAQTAVAQTPVEKGAIVFGAQKCSMCHSLDGKGNAKGPLDGIGSKLKADEIRQWIVTPVEMAAKAKATRKPPMKVLPNLSKDDLDALVAFLSSKKKKT